MAGSTWQTRPTAGAYPSRGELASPSSTWSASRDSEVLVQHLAAQEQAVEDGAVKCVDGELEIGILANLAPSRPRSSAASIAFAARRDDVAVEALGEIGVVLDVGDEPRDDMTAGRLSQDRDEPAEQRADVLPHRSSGRRSRDDLGAREIRLEHERRA